MTLPEIRILKYSYKKPATNVWVLNTDDIPLNKEIIKDQQIVHLAPNSIAGNHKHPRTEWFIGIGDLVFIWLDDNGQKHEEHMHPEGQIKLIKVPPFLPHAVVNRSQNNTGFLFEMSDGKMKDVEQVKIV